jgi:flavin-dependent dehydrogenase
LRGGLRVAQLDAARFPRQKPCAGGLTPKAVHALPCELAPSLRGAFADFEFNAWRGRRTVYSFRASVISMVSRPELDNRLVEENRRHAGFSFHDGERVRAVEWRHGRFFVTTETRRLSAPQLVGADGANGVVNRSLRLSRPCARAVAVELNLRRADLSGEPGPRPCFDFGAIEHGYGWVFPKDESVCVGLYTFARGLRDLRARLVGYLAAKGLRCTWAPGFEAHTIPVGGHRLRAPRRPVYLVGDAGGFADALTGEGIYHALESGRLAGETAVGVARGEREPASYLEALEPRVLRDTRWSWRLARVFYRRPDLALRALRKSGLWRPLVHGTGSGATFGECLTHSAPFFLRSLAERSARCSLAP